MRITAGQLILSILSIIALIVLFPFILAFKLAMKS